MDATDERTLAIFLAPGEQARAPGGPALVSPALETVDQRPYAALTGREATTNRNPRRNPSSTTGNRSPWPSPNSETNISARTAARNSSISTRIPSSARNAGPCSRARRERGPAAKAEEEEDTEVATPAGVEVVSLDEVEASEEKAAAEPVVDDIDVEEDDAEAPDDPFLEEEEEDDDDVTNLIDGDIAPDEET